VYFESPSPLKRGTAKQKSVNYLADFSVLGTEQKIFLLLQHYIKNHCK